MFEMQSEDTEQMSSPNHTASVLITREDEEDENTLEELAKNLDDSALSTGVGSPKHLKVTTQIHIDL